MEVEDGGLRWLQLCPENIVCKDAAVSEDAGLDLVGHHQLPGTVWKL